MTRLELREVFHSHYFISMTLLELSKSLHDCQRCKLAKMGRTQVVFGVGNLHARVMFVGEAPGFHEDRQGEPFVGAAGKLLNDLLQSASLSREDIYIANVIKCRPPNNRDPEMDEVETCKPFLMQQIAMIHPKLVCTLGNWATQTLLERKVGITKVRGRAFYLKDFILFPLLHPAAALHQGNMLEPLREDFKKLKEFLDRQSNPIELHETKTTPHLPTLQIDPPQPAQLDLFG
ncbi:MAG: uracil-DNA glycosylase [Nitrospiraceae bacterium]